MASVIVREKDDDLLGVELASATAQSVDDASVFDLRSATGGGGGCFLPTFNKQVI